VFEGDVHDIPPPVSGGGGGIGAFYTRVPARIERETLKMAKLLAATKGDIMDQEALQEAQRQELLALLDRYTQDGARRVNWLTMQDEQVCVLCAAREQRALTIAEARTALQGRWCEAGDPERGCRCTLTVVETDFDEMP
jgi:hypothetical protein